MHLHLNSVSSDAEYIDKLVELKNTVREYGRIFQTELDESVKTATLTLIEEPQLLQEHIRLTARQYLWLLRATHAH